MPRPITDTLRLLDEGAFIDTCSARMAALVRSVEETGKAGKLTITLQVKRGTKGAMLIHPEVKTQIPETKLEPTMLWATPEGNLTIDNPKQQKLDLRQVDTTTGELRSTPTTPADLRQAS